MLNAYILDKGADRADRLLKDELGFRLSVEYRRCLVREFSVLSMTGFHGGIKAREDVTKIFGTLPGYFILGDMLCH